MNNILTGHLASHESKEQALIMVITNSNSLERHKVYARNALWQCDFFAKQGVKVRLK